MIKKVNTKKFPNNLSIHLEDSIDVFAHIVAMLNVTFYRLFQIKTFDFITPLYKNDAYYRCPVVDFNMHIRQKDVIKNLVDNTIKEMYAAYNKTQYIRAGEKRTLAKLGYASKSLHSESDLEVLVDNNDIELLLILDMKRKSIDCIYTRQYRSSVIDTIINVFFLVFEYSLAHSMDNIACIPIVTKKEYKEILYMSSGERGVSNCSYSLMELLNHRFKQFPNKPCLIYTDQKCYDGNLTMEVRTYGEVEMLSYKAAGLINLFKENSSAVAIITENPLLLTIGIIGGFIAGIPILTLDYNIPETRMDTIIFESDVKIIISDSINYWHKYESMHFIGMEEIEHYIDVIQKNKNIIPKTGYIMYTSGTTGKPKRFFIAEAALLNYIIFRIENYNVSSEDRVLQLLAPSFDGFFSNFFTSLLSGATLVMPGMKLCSNYEIIPIIIERYRITHFSIVPCILEQIVEKAKTENFKFMKSIVLGGDFSSDNLIKKCQMLNSGICLINEYGPSENCVATTANLRLINSDIHDIGKPLPGTEVYILNKNKDIVPANIKGDIYVGGAQLTNGYLTEEENYFINNPFIEGELLFKTGDIGYWKSNGTIWLSGRFDNQVNINGCRIELEEVEQAIKTYDKVNQAVVSVLEEDKVRFLCADIKGEKGLTSRMVREYLLDILPTYMIPQRICISDKLPLTNQGKPDRKKSLERSYYKKEVLEMAEKIISLWNELLNKEISVFDDFFESGGSSLKIVVFVNEFQKRFKSEIKIKDIFKYSTAIELAQIMKAGKNYEK